MEDILINNVIKDKPIVIPRFLFKNYKKIGINEEELVILIYMIDFGDKVIYDPDFFVRELGMEKYKAMELINSLIEKSLVSLKVENNDDGKMEEYLYLDGFYNKLFSVLLDCVQDENRKNMDSSVLFDIFEQELGRTLSPMEIERIKEWLDDNFTEELVIEALKEAVFKNAKSMNYINTILYNWKQKGIKTREEALNDKRNYRNNKKTSAPVFDYNWLEEDDE